MLSAVMTVYNESEYVDFAIQSCISHVDQLVVVEGAYQETISLGKSPRSTDGTLEILEKWKNNPKVLLIYANEKTDKDQRNIGLNAIKKTNADGWILIVDGDEVHKNSMLTALKSICMRMEKYGQYAAYFSSFTFVNDFNHYTKQEFPRLFRISPKCHFIDDNYMEWPDHNKKWNAQSVIKLPYISYFHYAFCKNKERFLTKKEWWETRFKNHFKYDWEINEQNQIVSSTHKILPFSGSHPEVIQNFIQGQ
jgi:glycosyltransferase involved in cell wall biosynthesis